MVVVPRKGDRGRLEILGCTGVRGRTVAGRQQKWVCRNGVREFLRI